MRHLRSYVAALALGAAWALQEGCARAAEEGGTGEIFGNVGESVAAILIFLVLLTVLRKYAWKPILAQLHKREATISDALTSAETRERQAKETLTAYQQRIDRVEEEAQQVLARSRQEGLAAKEALLGEAREEARKVSEEQRREIERAKQDAMRELYESTAEIAADMASQVLRRRLSPEDQRRIMAGALGEIGRQEGAN